MLVRKNDREMISDDQILLCEGDTFMFLTVRIVLLGLLQLFLTGTQL